MDDVDRLSPRIVLDYAMRHQKQQMPFHKTQCLPSSFAALDAILFREREGMEIYARRDFETDAVLFQIGAAFATF